MSKICIIGAGMAGLAAAEVILTANKDADLTILEALDRIGGRAYTEPLDGAPMDWGCEALEAGDKAPTAALNKFGTVLAPIDEDDETVNKATSDKCEPADILSSKYDPVFLQFDFAGTKTTDITDNVAGAAEKAGDIITTNQEAVQADFYGDANDNVLTGVDLSFGDLETGAVRQNALLQEIVFGEAALPGTVSLRDYVRAEKLRDMYGYKGGAVYFAEGLGATVEAWAKTVLDTGTYKNLTVALNVQVTEVKHGEDGVVVTDADKTTTTFDAVLITVPTDVISKGNLNVPDLPKPAQQAFAACPLGYYYKVAVTGLKGVQLPAPNRRLVTTPEWYGNQAQVAQHVSGKFCYLHASGETAALFTQNQDWAEAYLIQALQAMNGGALDESEAKYFHTQWHSLPQFGGAYSHCDYGKNEARLVLGNLNVGKIYFAGEACSLLWYGQLAGAMESGQRMARLMLEEVEG